MTESEQALRQAKKEFHEKFNLLNSEYEASKTRMGVELNSLIKLAFEEQKSMIINELSKKLKWIEIHPKIIKCIENAPSPNQEDKL